MAEAEEKEVEIPNRQVKFSEAFKEFMPKDWAPYPSEVSPANLPAPLPASAPAKARREKLSAAFPGERLILPAGGLKVRNNDCDYAFRPHSAFAYETGLGEDREPDSIFIMEPVEGGHEARFYFHPRVPRTDPEFYSDSTYGEMWVGQRESIDEMAALTQLDVRDISDADDVMKENLKEMGVRVVRDADPRVTEKIDGWREELGIDLAYAQKKDDELAQWLSLERMIKDEFEIAEMQSACDRTATAFEGVVRQFPEAINRGRGERWVEGVFGLYSRHLGNDVGYGSIVAGGDHANTLHWVRNDGDLRSGDLVLIDAGIEIESLYTADVTRTLPLNGKFTDAQRKVYDAVLEAQQAGMAAAKPGNKFKDVHQAAIEVIARKLEEWGLLPVSAEETLDPEKGGQWRRWMVHGTSHHLGIDVHDCALARNEDYREAELKPGMVITVEPGIYFKSTDLLVPEELRGIGVRIEDDIVITEDGCRVLSDKLPRLADEVESWMAWLWAGAKK
ncbi:MAG: aminopeptidase P family protein [Propionibacteriaceae bacterium]|jgi:Xaa-Pro aminopeptidase|nr:aminopeptidase P family protein [Propionibacteriaceae bacterium]